MKSEEIRVKSEEYKKILTITVRICFVWCRGPSKITKKSVNTSNYKYFDTKLTPKNQLVKIFFNKLFKKISKNFTDFFNFLYRFIVNFKTPK